MAAKVWVELTFCADSEECTPETGATSNFDKAQTVIDECGIIQTVASVDKRPVDGKLTEVTIKNNRNSTCPTFAPLSALEVIVKQTWWNRFEHAEVTTSETFEADDFAMIKPSTK